MACLLVARSSSDVLTTALGVKQPHSGRLRPPTQTCLRCNTGISPAATRLALLGADLAYAMVPVPAVVSALARSAPLAALSRSGVPRGLRPAPEVCGSPGRSGNWRWRVPCIHENAVTRADRPDDRWADDAAGLEIGDEQGTRLLPGHTCSVVKLLLRVRVHGRARRQAAGTSSDAEKCVWPYRLGGGLPGIRRARRRGVMSGAGTTDGSERFRRMRLGLPASRVRVVLRVSRQLRCVRRGMQLM